MQSQTQHQPNSKAGTTNPPVGKVWFAAIEYKDLDLKRPEWGCHHIGVFSTRRAAIIAGVTASLELNGQFFEEAYDPPPDAAESVKQRWAAEEAVQAAYVSVARKVNEVNFDDDEAVKAYEEDHKKTLTKFLDQFEHSYHPLWESHTVVGDEVAEKRYGAAWSKFDANNGVIPWEADKRLKIAVESDEKSEEEE